MKKMTLQELRAITAAMEADGGAALRAALARYGLSAADVAPRFRHLATTPAPVPRRTSEGEPVH